MGRGQAGRGNLTTRVRLTALAAYCADNMVAAFVGDAAPSEVSREAVVDYRATGEAAS